MENKIVIFGAGKIGRSFIGQLFETAGYEIIFIDINKDLISTLNERGKYNVVFKSEAGEQVIEVANVRGITSNDTEQVVKEIATCSLAAVSVGQQGLSHIMKVLAAGILERQKRNEEPPIDIIIAENMRNAGRWIYRQLKEILPKNFPFDEKVGLIETSIGKMVPLMTERDMKKDPLQVFAEPYNTLIVDADGFKSAIPQVKGLAPKQNIKAWVDRKLFIHNLGHSAAAYFGYYHLPDRKYIYEVLEDQMVYKFTKNSMQESAKGLFHLYPDVFKPAELDDHISDLLSRFKNKVLGDTVFRVGCDLPRKLGSEDRLAFPIKKTSETGSDFDNMLLAYITAFRFCAQNEQGRQLETDRQVHCDFLKNDIRHSLKKYGGFSLENDKLILDRADWINSFLTF